MKKSDCRASRRKFLRAAHTHLGWHRVLEAPYCTCWLAQCTQYPADSSLPNTCTGVSHRHMSNVTLACFKFFQLISAWN